MSRIFLSALCLMLLATLSACSLFQETPEARARRLEPMLSAAGFNILPADNDQKISAIQSLPPLKMRYYTKDGKLRYWFADPDYCHCVYVGNETAYQSYQKLKLQSQMAQQSEMAAELNEDAAEQLEMPNPFFWGGY